MELTLSARSLRGPRREAALVDAARRGDDRAFEELYAQYRGPIHAFIVSRVRDHGRAEDLGQEVFMSALRQLRASDAPILFKPWLYTIAKNACIDEFRRAGRGREVPIESDEELAAGRSAGRFVSGLPTPAAAIESKQSLDDLRGAFGGLSDSQHRLLVLREFEGLSYEAIGERLGMTKQMVESGLFRARRKLSDEYAELASGRRCAQIQTAIDAGQLRLARSLGIKDRRRYARHLSHCQPCRHVAMMAAVDETLLKPRSIAARVAALLPFPLLSRLWPFGRGGRAATQAATHHSAATAAGAAGSAGGAGAAGAAGAAGSAGAVGAGAGAGIGVGVGQAAAVLAAALAGVGGSYAIVHQANAHHGAPAPVRVVHRAPPAAHSAPAPGRGGGGGGGGSRAAAGRHAARPGRARPAHHGNGPGHGTGGDGAGGRSTVAGATTTRRGRSPVGPTATPLRHTPITQPGRSTTAPRGATTTTTPTGGATPATPTTGTTTSSPGRTTTTTSTTVRTSRSAPSTPSATTTVGVTVTVPPVVSTVTSVVQTVVTSATNGVQTVLTSATNGVQTVLTSATNGVQTVLTSATNGVKSVIGGLDPGPPADVIQSVQAP